MRSAASLDLLGEERTHRDTRAARRRLGSAIYLPKMIVSLHVATGGAAGYFAGSRTGALLLGLPLHLAADRVPHEDIPDRRFEVGSGLVCLGLLAACRGPFDRVTLGAAASSAPDLEHIFSWLRPGGKKLFHRGGGSPRARRLPTGVQLLLAGAILGSLLGSAGAGPDGGMAPETARRNDGFP